MSLDSFEYHSTTRMVFGSGTLARLGELARQEGAGKVLLVTDPGLEAAGHAGQALRSLEGAGLRAVVFDGVEENPTTRHVEAGVRVARAEGIDFLVGLGGGSAMDCAKGVNFVFSCGGEMRDYWGVGKATAPMLPMIAVPTTTGTGSENQSFALISDPETHQKMACGDRRAACRVAILDPELAVSQPRRVAAATGIDALSHAVESFVTRRRTAVSRAFSRQAWILLSGSFERMLRAPGDLEAHARMLLGASLAGMAIESSMLGAAHSAANPLTAHHGVIHGNAVGILVPAVVRFNAEAVGSDYRELALLAGAADDVDEAPGDALAKQLERFLSLSGLPTRLSEWGVSEALLPRLAEEASTQWTAQFNPRPASAADFRALYRGVL